MRGKGNGAELAGMVMKMEKEKGSKCIREKKRMRENERGTRDEALRGSVKGKKCPGGIV